MKNPLIIKIKGFFIFKKVGSDDLVSVKKKSL
jgi:hypothetical protein